MIRFRQIQNYFVSIFFLGIVSGFSCCEAQTPKRKTSLSDRYGFRSLEVYKVSQRSSQLLAADLTDDGLNDILVADNSHSRFDLFVQRKEKKTASFKRPDDINFVENDRRFDHVKIPVTREIVSAEIGSFSKPGLAEIVFLGAPDRIVILTPTSSGKWKVWKTLRLPDLLKLSGALAVGDLNGDGRDDLAVLGKYQTYLLYLNEARNEFETQKVMNTSQGLRALKIADVDGDGRNDLAYSAGNRNERSLCVRFQSGKKSLGPELRFSFQKIRGFDLTNLDGQPGLEAVSIDQRTGRIAVDQLSKKSSGSQNRNGKLVHYGFGRADSGDDRDLAIGDVDGNGLDDVVVTDPTVAQMIVYRQKQSSGLASAETFPGLVDASQIRVYDIDGDKKQDLFVLSQSEKTIGLSRFENGRLTFPQPLPVEGEPVAFEMANMDGGNRKELIYISKSRKSGSSIYVWKGLKWQDGTWKSFELGNEKLPIQSAPNKILRIDANHDGHPEFLVFRDLDQGPLLYTHSKDGELSRVTATGGIQLGDISAGAIFQGQLETPAFLIAQKNFARNLQLDAENRWMVKDQYNATETDSKVAGVATLDMDGKPGHEVVLVDTGVKKLRVLRRDQNLYKPWKEIELGNFPFRSCHVSDFNSDGKNDLLLFGDGKFAVIYIDRDLKEFNRLAEFESRLRNTYFSNLISGDINGDGKVDLVAVDTRSHYIEILNFDNKNGLKHALHFKLFEEKSFTRRASSGSEPREGLIVDVTGDGLNDLVILSHDRVLVYPQDDGK